MQSVARRRRAVGDRDVRFDDMAASLAERIDAILPQTQCTKCGFDGCRPYAEAIAAGSAPIDRCPPGGTAGIARLAALLGRPATALDPTCGAEGPHRRARIVEAHCIGCTRCITACPLDAIIGAPKAMHTVIEPLCSGCELCVPACPVDCIEMFESPAHPSWTPDDANAARARSVAHRERLERERIEDQERLERKALGKLARLAGEPPDDATARKRAVIEAAIRNARERRAAATAGRPR